MNFKKERLNNSLSPSLSEFSENGKVNNINPWKFQNVKGKSKRKVAFTEMCFDNAKHNVSLQTGRFR